jgi:uncharacterized lipoprotein
MKFKIVLALATLASLSACGSTGVFDRERPDEFAVTKAAPLVVPADLNTLPPPQTGAAAPAKDSKQDMLDAMFGAPKSN